MKPIFAILTILLLICCDDNITENKNSSCQEIEHNTSLEINLESSACLPDGRLFKIIQARDEFCPCDVICIWEGQLVIVIETEDLDQTTTEVTVCSTKNIPHGDLFEDVSITDFTYLYNEMDDSLPLCQGTFNPNEIKIILTLAH